MKKKLALLLAVAIVAAMVFTCSIGMAEEEHKPVTLTCWFVEGEKNYLSEAWVGHVTEVYPWITVKAEFIPADSIAEKATVAYATGGTPDIYVDGYSRLAPAVEAGICLDLTDVVESHKDDFIGEIIDGIVDGKNYYIATGAGNGYALVVNMDLARELGVDGMLPEDGLTWSYDQFLDACRAAKKANPDIIPMPLFAGSQSSDAWYYTLLISNGSQITENGKTVVNQGVYREKALETLGMLKTLIDEGLTSTGCATMIDMDCSTLFNAGRVLFLNGAFNGAWSIRDQQKNGTCQDFDFDIIGVPTAEGKEIPLSASWGSSGIIGFDHGDDTAEATKLAITAMIEDKEDIETQLNEGGGYTNITGITQTFTDEVTRRITEGRGAVYSAAHTTSNFGIMEGWWSDYRATFYPQLQDFYTGKVDAETMLDNWQVAGDEVIANYNP